MHDHPTVEGAHVHIAAGSADDLIAEEAEGLDETEPGTLGEQPLFYVRVCRPGVAGHRWFLPKCCFNGEPGECIQRAVYPENAFMTEPKSTGRRFPRIGRPGLSSEVAPAHDHAVYVTAAGVTRTS